MIVIDKKKITLIITSIFLSIFIFVFTKDNLSEQKYYRSTTSLPISGKTIVIDAGHGKPDERCRKLKWNNRSRNKFENCIKTSKLA